MLPIMVIGLMFAIVGVFMELDLVGLAATFALAFHCFLRTSEALSE